VVYAVHCICIMYITDYAPHYLPTGTARRLVCRPGDCLAAQPAVAAVDVVDVVVVIVVLFIVVDLVLL
jgi:hypothetical protein